MGWKYVTFIPIIFFFTTPSLADTLEKKIPPSLMRFFNPIILQETNFFFNGLSTKIYNYFLYLQKRLIAIRAFTICSLLQYSNFIRIGHSMVSPAGGKLALQSMGKFKFFFCLAEKTFWNSNMLSMYMCTSKIQLPINSGYEELLIFQKIMLGYCHWSQWEILPMLQ